MVFVDGKPYMKIIIIDSQLQRKGSVCQKIKLPTGEEIRAGITKLDRFRNGIPCYGSLADPRMGSSSLRARCKTCEGGYEGMNAKMDDCPGHFGHIELCRPVYHSGFINEITRILSCVCFHCSRLLLDEKVPKDRDVLKINDPETRFRKIHERCNRANVRCETIDPEDIAKVLDGLNLDSGNGMDGGADGGGAAGDEYGAGENGKVKTEAEELMQMMSTPGAVGESGDSVSSQQLKKAPCGRTMPRFSKNGLVISVIYPDDMETIPGTGQKRQELSPSKVFEIFKRISDEDVIKLGFDPKWARPEWMLVSVLPVPPPHVRPTVIEGTTTSEDDLTFQLMNILKANLTLEASLKGEARHIVADFEKLLQQRVVAFFDNERDDNPRETQKTGRPLKTIRQRLKGKEGRLRGNLMGKRVDFSARTVITADPNLSVDQVGVPRSVGLILTVPIVVTPFNINYLSTLVARGPTEWPGANYIVRSDGTRKDLRYARDKNDFVLEYGWTVERHLQDDDIVLFNRQPSLHKMSIMGHRAKILDWSTFRLNLSVTTPYNADFDGDEMNLHVPQSINARADAQELMMTVRNIVTPQSNRNVMGIVQDALLGVNRMTKRDVFIDKSTFMNALMWIADWDGFLPAPAIIKPKPLWTGKQLFSMICPKINYVGKSKNHVQHPTNDKDPIKDPFMFLDSNVLIHSGQLMHGIVDKNIVGASGGSVVHICWLQLGWEETRAFMNQIQCVVNYWMVNTSYSVGVADTVADADTINNIQATLDEAKTKVDRIMAKGQMGQLKMMPGKPLMESFEVNINEVLNDTRSTVGKSAQKSLKERNAIKGTVMAGSKGSELNLSQIIACVGQQNVQGKRIRFGFKQRTLPHFAKDDLGMESRGFVENSYLRGLTPAEFYFHAMGGREGVIDTAVKTAETGYIQRRLVKAMESVMARYDTTLRNSRGCVMQFLYGEDGMDAQRIEKQFFDNYKATASKFREAYYMDLSNEHLGQTKFVSAKTGERMYYLAPSVVQDCRMDSELRLMLDDEYEQLLRDRITLRQIMDARGAGAISDESTYLPVNIDRLIWTAQRQFQINTSEPTTLHPRAVIDDLKRLIAEGITVVRGDDHFSVEAQNNATMLFQILLRCKLSAKRVLKDYRLSEEAWKWLLGSIVSDFRSSLVNPGEMCGVLAAQSIGEPATQMTLNTFHSSGIGSKNVTLGVPRLNEILNMSKNIKTPSVTINLKVRDDEREATDLMHKIEFTRLGDITLRTEIHYDPDPRTSVIDEDRDLVVSTVDFAEFEGVNMDEMSPWVLRIILDPKFINARVVLDSTFTIADIATKITEYFGNGVHVIYSDVNSQTGFVLRVRLVVPPSDMPNPDGLGDEDGGTNFGQEDHELLRRMQRNLLDNLHLYGVPGIKKVYYSQKKAPYWDENDGFGVRQEWVLETDGSNLAEILTYPQVDHRATQSNDVVEMFQVLGIEGARASLFNELRGVLSFDGAYVNCRHITCLADCMTFGGYLMAVSRHGINKGETGPLLRASFEETVEVFMNSAAFSHYDMLTGVTENIMLGQLGRLGTGMVDLLLDYDKLALSIDTVNTNYAQMLATEDEEVESGKEGAITPYSMNTPMNGGDLLSGGGMMGGLLASTTPHNAGALSPIAYTPHGAATPHLMGYQSPFHSASGVTPMGQRTPVGLGGASPYLGGASPYHSAVGSGMLGAPSPGYVSMSPKISPAMASSHYSPTRYVLKTVLFTNASFIVYRY